MKTTETPTEIIDRHSLWCVHEILDASSAAGSARWYDIVRSRMVSAVLEILIPGPSPGREAPQTSPAARHGVLTARVAVDGGRKAKRARTKRGARCKAS